MILFGTKLRKLQNHASQADAWFILAFPSTKRIGFTSSNIIRMMCLNGSNPGDFNIPQIVLVFTFLPDLPEISGVSDGKFK